MNRRVATLAVMCLLPATTAAQPQAPPRMLEGRLFQTDSDDQRVYLPNVIVKIIQGSHTGKTAPDGTFSVPLPAGVEPGDDLDIEAMDDKWVIRGNPWRFPRQLPRPVPFEAVKKGDPTLLSGHTLRALVERNAKTPRAGEAPDSVKGRDEAAGRGEARAADDPGTRAFAVRNGFSLKDVQAALVRWADTTLKTSRDTFERGLALNAKQQYAGAAAQFSAAALQYERGYAEIVQQREAAAAAERKLATAAIDARVAEGKALQETRNWEGATVAFTMALQIARRDTRPDDWALVQVHLASLEMIRSSNGEPVDEPTGLARAVTYLQASLQVLTAETQPREWAGAQTQLGLVLLQQQRRTNDIDVRTKLLAEAQTALQAALRVLDRSTNPADWAETQNVLAGTLMSQGSGASRPGHIESALTIYREVLAAYDTDATRGEWAMAQNNLAFALTAAADVLPPREAMQALDEAVAAYRAALDVYGRSPSTRVDESAAVRANIGMALTARAMAEREKPAALQSLREAIASYRAAIAAVPRERSARQWALTENNFAFALNLASGLVEPPERMTMLAQSEAAYRAALTVFTPTSPRRHWQTQSNLGDVLVAQARLVHGAPRDERLAAAEQAYAASLTLLRYQDEPDRWKEVQRDLAFTLADRVDLASGAQAGVLAGRAVDLLEQLLERDGSDVRALVTASELLREILFDFRRQRALLERWLPKDADLVLQLHAAENLLTTGDWKAASARCAAWRDDERVMPRIRVIFGAYAIAAAIAQHQPVDPEIGRLAGQAVSVKVGVDTARPWTVEPVRRAVTADAAFAESRTWLLDLLTTVETASDDTLVDGLRAAQASAPKPATSPKPHR